jgi:hypothetical protein
MGTNADPDSDEMNRRLIGRLSRRDLVKTRVFPPEREASRRHGRDRRARRESNITALKRAKMSTEDRFSGVFGVSVIPIVNPFCIRNRRKKRRDD